MVNLGMHSGKGPLSHEAKEAAFMKLFYGVGADSAVMDSKNSFSKPADFSAMPSAPPAVEDVSPLERSHRPDPKLADDDVPWVPHNIHKHAGAGTQLDAREAAFVKLFDHPVKQYAQAAAVDNVDMAKLPDRYEAQDWSSSAAKAEARGIDELRDSSSNAVAAGPREQWKPKNMAKKMSQRGEEMHEGFLKIFENEPVRTA